MLSGASQALRWLRLRARRARTPSRQQMPARAGHVPSTSQQGFPGAARPNTFLSHEWGGTRYLLRFLTVSKGGSCRKTQSSRAQVPKVTQGLILSTSYTSAPPGRDVCHPWADEFREDLWGWSQRRPKGKSAASKDSIRVYMTQLTAVCCQQCQAFALPSLLAELMPDTSAPRPIESKPRNKSPALLLPTPPGGDRSKPRRSAAVNRRLPKHKR